MLPLPPRPTLFPYTMLFRSVADGKPDDGDHAVIRPVMFEVDAEHARARHAAEPALAAGQLGPAIGEDRKSTRLNSSHLGISYAVFCLKKKKKKKNIQDMNTN